MESSDDIKKNEKKLFRLILNKLKNVIVVINKMDLVKDRLKKKEEHFKFFFDKNYPNILNYSSKISKLDIFLRTSSNIFWTDVTPLSRVLSARLEVCCISVTAAANSTAAAS